MAFDRAAAQSVQDALISHALSLGVFENVNGHEPTNAPGNGLVASFWLQRMGPAIGLHSGLASTSAVLIWQARITQNNQFEPQDAIDPNMMGAAADLIAAYSAAFTLGGLIRAVDLRGMAGTPLSCDAGYLPQDNVLYRAYVLTIPLIFNDAWTEAA